MENVANWLTCLFKKTQDKFDCIIVSWSNDNCSRIDSPMHIVSMKLGLLHPRCIPHAGNLSLKDLFASKHPVCVLANNLLRKMNDLCKIVMNRKAPLKLFKESQTSMFLLQGLKKKPKILLRPSGTRWTCKTNGWIRFNELVEHVEYVLTKSKWKISAIHKMLREDIKKLVEDETLREMHSTFEEELEEQEPFQPDVNDDDADQEESNSLEEYKLSAMEQEQIHNFAIGFFSEVNKFMTKIQIHRLSLLEWMFLWKEARIYVARILKWDKLDLIWIKDIKLEYHATAKKEIQELWLEFMKIMDQRSSQFNDRLVSLCESFQPFPVGMQHSFVDHEEVMYSFLGKGETPEEPQKNSQLWDLGPMLCLRLLEWKSKTSPLMLPTLDKLREDLHGEYSIFSERSTWMESWKGKSKDPLYFWDQKKTRFPLLSLGVSSLMKIDVTNVNVERSMKI